MNIRAYQVATTQDTNEPLRKWFHRGTHRHPSSLDCAYCFGKGILLKVFCAKDQTNKLVYQFSENFVCVGF
jgi:hypothetical protein